MSEAVHEHVDSGWRCLDDHAPGTPPCWKCATCGKWYIGWPLDGYPLRPAPTDSPWYVDPRGL